MWYAQLYYAEIFHPKVYVVQVLFKTSLKIVENYFFIKKLLFRVGSINIQHLHYKFTSKFLSTKFQISKLLIHFSTLIWNMYSTFNMLQDKFLKQINSRGSLINKLTVVRTFIFSSLIKIWFYFGIFILPCN